ncbi:MAG TPA: phosphate ABC transporter substrate-binding protein PstS family protein [Candidatus Saccharimonadales bacterium]|nr:phosphate ABC transporter substrate-binding protein PstS family protein [Candidatus Saccharimonadales bacterium]
MFTTARRLGALAIATAFLVAACSSSGSSASPAPSTGASTAAGSGAYAAPTCVSGSITVVGSTALQPLVDAAGKAYVTACPQSTVNVQGGGSGTGLTQVSQGAAQIGDSDIFAGTKLATPDANALVDHQVVKQGWLMVTNKDVSGVTNLTTAQATAIWTGKTTNWKDVGGPDEPIVLILRPASSGTRATFKQIVLNGADEAAGQALTEDSNGAVSQAVQQTKGSTSVIGFAYYFQGQATLNGLQLDGVTANVANMLNGSYKLSAFGHMYTKGQPTGLTKAFLDYMYSDAVQKGIEPGLYFSPVPPSS